ncbi:hypothetical protein CCUS01_04334 [Colletotrichum cuscutae]|uniref:Uncharacterized protein n=1 Tax=Colletotrichum cuscutae TaxID=1209917 RepID=A0AAI9VDG7_9PEZI|nr:hypothetical protein CCUS01_04334 [Colletotrichum cuscutae]
MVLKETMVCSERPLSCEGRFAIVLNHCCAHVAPRRPGRWDDEQKRMNEWRVVDGEKKVESPGAGGRSTGTCGLRERVRCEMNGGLRNTISWYGGVDQLYWSSGGAVDSTGGLGDVLVTLGLYPLPVASVASLATNPVFVSVCMYGVPVQWFLSRENGNKRHENQGCGTGSITPDWLEEKKKKKPTAMENVADNLLATEAANAN